jgi:tRNA pseudouridine38-40 synthase
MPHFKLTVAYDGAGFVGWQRQPTGTSIQGLLEEALSRLDKRRVTVTGAGRTDAGVHALGQVAGCALERDIDAATLVRALNAALPESVRVRDAAEVSAAFHPRFDARSKSYRFRIWNDEVLMPFERGYVWHIPTPRLDVGAMAEAAALLVGRHDFAAFQGAGSETNGTERVILASRLARDPESLIVYDVCGEGFLRHMVRNIVGTLVEIGRGRHPAAWIEQVLASRDRTMAGRTAPAAGLFLVGVGYGRQL